MSITKDKKTQVIADFAINKDDTGSAQVQVAVLTERILSLSGHMKTHPKDFASRRGLLAMVSKRRSLLDYMKRKDNASYKDVIARLGLRY